MILSFHPCFEGDCNIICAGREPDENDLAAVRAAGAVILPQGCKRSLFEMAHGNCRHVFPNYKARFRYPGKNGQIQLFRETGTLHPHTQSFSTLEAFFQTTGSRIPPENLDFPLVFKFDWGGEGETVFLIQNQSDWIQALEKAQAFEAGGRAGFLIQTYIPSGRRVLRVAVIGRSSISYWRVQKDTALFETSLSKGAVIDATSDRQLRRTGIQAVRDFCRKTNINLAGFDLLFPSSSSPDHPPYFLEINYFFGRRGLGGSERFYAVLAWEIRRWIRTLLSK